MCFAENLKKLMQSNGISNYRLAKEVGCSATTVANWIAGKDIMPAYLQKVADFFNVTTDFLLTGEQKENALAVTGKDDIEFDDFTYAMQNESKELTEEDKALLLSMARQLKSARDKRNGKPD